MKYPDSRLLLALLTAAALLALPALSSGLHAGGPLILQQPGQPLLWGGSPPTVVIRFDTGALGHLTAAESLAHQQAAAQAWTDIPSSSMTIVDGGVAESIFGPEGAGDFAIDNILSVMGVNNGGLTPLVIDNEDVNGNGSGDIFDALGFTGVLGVASPEYLSEGVIREGLVLINGPTMFDSDSDGSHFRGVLVHELGHLLNLAHSVVNGQAVFFGGTESLYPDGTPLGAGVEHVETMYPFLAPFPGGTGVFQAQPSLDDIAILSTLYPQPGASIEQAATISGRVLSGLGTPRTGYQVIARNQDGDPLVDAVSAISGDFVQVIGPVTPFAGTYTLNMLTPGGRYSLELRDTRAGGFSTQVLRAPDFAFDSSERSNGPEEFYSGPDEDVASPPDDPQAAPFLIDVQAGGPAQAAEADIRLNEFTVPANDDCSQAVPVPLSQLPFRDVRKTRAATLEMGEENAECGFDADTRSVWYRLENDTADDLLVDADTALSDFFTVLQVFDGSCSNPQIDLEACGFGGFSIAGSLVRFTVAPGTSRLLRVADSFVGTGGDLVFSVREVELAPPPANDACPQAVVIDSLPFFDSRDVSGALTETSEPNIDCIFGAGDSTVWYSYLHDQPGRRQLLLSTAGSDYDTVIQVYEGSCDSLMVSDEVCDDDDGPGLTSMVSFTAIPGVRYFIKIAAFSGSAGNLQLTLEPAPGPPPNDDCVQAVPVTVSQLPFQDQVTTLNAGNEPNEPDTTCGSEDPAEQSASVWYRLSNDTSLPAQVLLSAEGGDANSVLQTYRGVCSAFLPLQCDVLSGAGFNGRLTATVQPGETIWIKSAAFGTQQRNEAVFSAQWLNPMLEGDLQLTLARLNERTTTAREPLLLAAVVANTTGLPVSNVILQVVVSETGLPVELTSPSGQCAPDALDGQLFTCTWNQLEPGQEVQAVAESVPRTGGEIDLTASLDWDQAPAGQENLSISLASSVRPFLVFPARLQHPLPTLFDNTFVGMAVVNITSQQQNLILQGLDGAGDSLFVTDPAALLEPRGQSALTTEQAGPLTAETRAIAARGQDDLEGFFMAGDLSLQRLDGIGRQLPRSRDLIFPVVQDDLRHSTQLFLFNDSAGRIPGIDLKLFNASGELLDQQEMEFPNSGSLLAPVSELFDFEQVKDGYITLHSPLPMKGFTFVASTDSMIAAAAQEPEPAFQLLAPHYLIDNQGGDTLVRLFNASQGPLQVRATIFDENGLALELRDFEVAPGEMFVSEITELFSIDAGPSGLRTGYLRFSLQPADFVGFFGPLGQVIGSVEFRTAQERTRSLLPMQAFGNELTRFFQVAQSAELGIFTGLAILNTASSDSQPATVTVRAYDAQGVIAAERIFALEGRSRILGLLNEDIYFGPSFELVTGHIEVQSSSPVFTFALFGDFSGRFLSAIEGQPDN
ncbi:MAG TPA: hypothetical protein VLU25_10760 [Acidobacteriota bacterium]|nr:hypothetical protein [Acidobacteriota bacterium]